MTKTITTTLAATYTALASISLAIASREANSETDVPTQVLAAHEQPFDQMEAAAIKAIATGDPDKALADTTKVLKDENYTPDQRRRLQELNSLCKAIIGIDERILASFKTDIWKPDMAVHFKKKTERVRIIAVRSSSVQCMMERSGAKTAKRFKIDDLSYKETLKRVGTDDEAHINIIRAFAVLPNTRVAVTLLKRDRDEVAARAIDALAENTVERLLEIAGISAAGGDLEQITEELESAEFSRRQVSSIKRYSEHFRKTFTGTTAFDKHASLIAALSNVRAEQASTDSQTSDSTASKSLSSNPKGSIFDKGPQLELKVKKHKHGSLSG